MTFQATRPRALTIIGPGRVGRSLHGAARAAGLDAELLDRDAVAALRPGALSGRVTLLAVPDAEIASACAALCTAARPEGPLGHLSGATPLTALAAARPAGSPVFSMHPLQTFPERGASLSGIPCAVTASDQITAGTASELATVLGMRPFSLNEESRAAYHAAASLASNFLVALEESAASLMNEIGIAEARNLLTPLVAQTVANWSEQGATALTGPIARGDELTVDRHVQALAQRAPELLDLYLALAERTRQVAAEAAAVPGQEPVGA